MTLAEKIGQMCQLNVGDQGVPDEVAQRVRGGTLGSIINVVDVDAVNALQRTAVHDSRLGIPLLVGRDVIHGFKTVMPIPLGQAASWNPDVVREGARIAASEAASHGINWTFAPMVDIARDPRWGRIAESLGEDPMLSSTLGAAMVEGFQGRALAAAGAIAACAKHFVGYGAAESGRDYATTNVPENELHNVHLRPFHAAVDAGVASLMTSFSDIDGVPATANARLVNGVLRDAWGFDGFVVSDWDSIRQLAIHGLTADDRESAYEAAQAGVDMEMQGDAYFEHLHSLVDAGEVALGQVDQAVANILRVKFRLGLFEQATTDTATLRPIADSDARKAAYQVALQGSVLLKNDGGALPLNSNSLKSIAVIGPLADDPYEQMGTWVFDGDAALSVTPLQSLRDAAQGKFDVLYAPGLDSARSRDHGGFEAAVKLAEQADAAVLVIGEDAILSGEAHSRADICLPGAQAELVRRVRGTGKPVIAVVMAGRPLTLGNILDQVDALLYAWHPGTMGGPAIADLLFGVVSPSGKLPVTFPRVVGQIPLYYNHKNTGKPPSDDTIAHIDDIDARAPQTSLGMTAFHLDVHFSPQFPFGFGLSYASFRYSDISVSNPNPAMHEPVVISCQLENTGAVSAEEVAQLYVRDVVGNVTRPVRELKGWQRVRLRPGESTTVEFTLLADDLAFYGRDLKLRTEPGEFHAWIGGSSAAELQTQFCLHA
ncbi:glycosyl hydrolase [bacterium]|nr:glycosyl hydrolase [bacterium]